MCNGLQVPDPLKSQCLIHHLRRISLVENGAHLLGHPGIRHNGLGNMMPHQTRVHIVRKYQAS